jgi:hypothetical protein
LAQWSECSSIAQELAGSKQALSTNGEAKACQIFLREAQVLSNNLAIGNSVNAKSSSLSDVSAVSSLVGSYAIHGGKREVLFFCSVSDTTLGNLIMHIH